MVVYSYNEYTCSSKRTKSTDKGRNTDAWITRCTQRWKMFYQVKLIRHKEYIVVGLPWWFSGWDFMLPRHRAWVQFRVGDLRSHMPHSAAKKKTKTSTLGMISFLKSSMMTKFRIVVSCYKGWAGKGKEEHEEIFWGTRNILHLFTIWLEVTRGAYGNKNHQTTLDLIN